MDLMELKRIIKNLFNFAPFVFEKSVQTLPLIFRKDIQIYTNIFNLLHKMLWLEKIFLFLNYAFSHYEISFCFKKGS